MEKTTELLTKILGEEAINNDLGFQVPLNIKKLAETVDYLTLHIGAIKKNSNDDVKDYIDRIIMESIKILESE